MVFVSSLLFHLVSFQLPERLCFSVLDTTVQNLKFKWLGNVAINFKSLLTRPLFTVLIFLPKSSSDYKLK